ncbi:MAG: SPASM domain-containing protein [Clostridia bacterium]|nr:SPASM domain-containing protein [Clostridia bacterium]
MQNRRKAFLEITNRCNLSCSFCPGTGRAPGMMDRETFSRFAKELSGWAGYLWFHVWGEPLLHPALPDFVGEAKGLGMRPMITTNGTLLQERGPELLSKDSIPFKVSISLHSFEANRGCDCLNSYLEDCFAFAREAAARGCLVAFRLWNTGDSGRGFAQNERNGEITDQLKRAFPAEWTRNRSGFRLGEGIFLETANRFDWPSPEGPDFGGTGFCYGLRDQVGVLCDGTVVPCCLDAEGVLALGNLKESALEEILASDRARAIYDSFTLHRCRESLCRRCERSQTYRTVGKGEA